MNRREQDERITECRESGKSIKEYCEEKGIPIETFRTWVKRSRKRSGQRSENKTYGEYRAIVVECKSSGKQAKEWCAEHGYSYGTYCGWSKKVNRLESRERINCLCGLNPITRQEACAKISENPPLCEVRR